MPINPDVWIPAASGAAGALVGAGASVLGSFINARNEEEKRRQERAQQIEDRRDENRRQILEEAASTLSQAFSLLHEISFVAETADPRPSAEQVDGVRNRWSSVRERLFVLGVGYPDPATAKTSMSLVGKFTEVIHSLECFANGTQSRDEASLDASFVLVMEVLDQVRAQGGLNPVYKASTPSAAAAVGTEGDSR